ncbi:MAG: ribosome biogenesis factor YjgA [Dokdonella sp.]
MSIDESDDEFLGPSRSHQRREALAVLKLAEALTALTDAQLARVPLDDNILDEVRRARATHQQVARKRQIQYVAKHMRRLEDDEIAAIRLVLDSDRQQSNRETASLHQVESWRDRLLDEGDSALDAWLALHPASDRQQLRTLMRQAKTEADRQKPPRAARELFRQLRDIHASSEPSTPAEIDPD